MNFFIYNHTTIVSCQHALLPLDEALLYKHMRVPILGKTLKMKMTQNFLITVLILPTNSLVLA